MPYFYLGIKYASLYPFDLTSKRTLSALTFEYAPTHTAYSFSDESVELLELLVGNLPTKPLTIASAILTALYLSESALLDTKQHSINIAFDVVFFNQYKSCLCFMPLFL